ncbi:cell division FtsA domain-containing protein [Mycoplasma sp. SG1]|uniref:cell division FtsA domain-containing protein n=1 Tax=Mycoplasma sp. SG1 TaxID=2810348 RepID=UPI002023FCF1|nr:cell division FtsA domain-containing protein [Mycoplasma sp. SG1]URM53183.1 rod shape-determining protein [Mycoplasma sp. SG1]
MNKMYATFDISTSGVKFAVIKISQNHVDPILTYYKRAKVMNVNGEICNDELLVEIIKYAVKNCEKTLDYTVDNVILNFPMINCKIKQSKRGILINKTLEVEDVAKLIGYSQELNGLNDNVLLTLIPESYEYDHHRTLIPPIGKKIQKLYLNSLVYLGNFKTYYRLLEIFKKAKISVSNFCLEAYATAYEVANKTYLKDGCVIVDFGAESVKISLFHQNLLVDYRVLKMGANSINKDIKYLIKDVGDKNIELLKLRYADLKAGYLNINKDKDSFLLNNDFKVLYSTDGQPLIDEDKLQEIVYWRTKEIFYKITELIRELTHGDSDKFKIIITGGGSAIKGLDCFFEKENYFTNYKIYKSTYIGVKNPIYCNVVGIGIYQNMVNYVSDHKINSLKHKSLKERIFNTLNLKILKLSQKNNKFQQLLRKN